MKFDRGGITVDGVAHLQINKPARPAQMTIVVAGPDTIAFEASVANNSRPTVYIDKFKARAIAEYILKVTGGPL